MRIYNCEECDFNTCFRKNRKQKIKVKVPRRKGLHWIKEEKEIGYKDVFLLLIFMQRQTPDVPIFYHFYYLFEREYGVCPIPFLKREFEELIILQDHCERYSCLPFNGNLESQPAWLINSFTEIVAAKNEFSRYQRQLQESSNDQ